MKILLSNTEIETIYVIGIALEYVVQSTCIGAANLGKTVRAIEPLIGTTGGNRETIEGVWHVLLKVV